MKQSISIDQQFTKLSKNERFLLKIIAIIDSPQPVNKILQICSKLKANDKYNLSFNTRSLGLELENFKVMGLLKKSINQKYALHADYFDFFFRKALKDSKFSKIRKVICDVLPGAYAKQQYNVTFENLFRDLNYYVYKNDHKSYEVVRKQLQSNYDVDMNELYQTIFDKRYGKKNLHQLCEELQLAYYKSILKKQLFNLECIEDELINIQRIIQNYKGPFLSFLKETLSLNALLKGEIGQVDQLWSNQNGIEKQLFLAWKMFVNGQNTAAFQLYENLQLEIKKSNSNRIKFLNGYHAVIYMLTLLKESNFKYMHKVKSLFKAVFAEGAPYVFRLFKYLTVKLEKSQDYDDDLLSQEFLYYNLDGLFYLYTQYWTNTYASNIEKYAYTLFYKAHKNDYKWVAYNIADLMRVISRDKKSFYQNAFDELSKSLNHLPTLLEVINIKEPWEIRLKEIQSLFVDQHAVFTRNPSRLIWIVDFKNFNFIPKIQRINKNGQWSKGRNVPLNKLIEEDFNEITAYDLKIINTLSKNEFNPLGEQKYTFNHLKETLKAMIDHPLLFHIDSNETAISLIEHRPEIYLNEYEDHYILKTMDRNELNFKINRETPTRYSFIDFNNRYQKFQELSNGNMKIPKQGLSNIRSLLKSIDKELYIYADFDYDDRSYPVAIEDTRTFVHLMPVGEKFHVEFFVKPYGKQPPYFKHGDGPQRIIAKVNGVKSQIVREYQREKDQLTKILESCPSLEGTSLDDELWVLPSSMDCLRFLKELEILRTEQLIAVEWPRGEKLKIRNFIHYDQVSLSIQKDNQWFSLNGKINIDDKLVMDFRKLIQLNERNSEFIELDDGQFLALGSKLQEKLNQLKNLTDDQMRINPILGFALEDILSDANEVIYDNDWKAHMQKLRDLKEKKYALPKAFSADLRDYQKLGYQWLSRLADWGVGACLADDMGLGKTVQSLAIILQKASDGPTLVVAPASVCRNWYNEIVKFTPGLNPIIFGEDDRKKTLQSLGKMDVLISTYGLLQSEILLFETHHFETIVLDEAQAIKNSTSKRSKAAMRLKANFKLVTTGTPIENHLSELWNIFRFINPGLLGNSKYFKNRFAIPIEKNQDTLVRSQLQRIIQPFILRRNKTEVLSELPPKTEVVLNVSLNEAERSFYEALRLNALDSLQKEQPNNGQGTMHIKVLAHLMRLRRACCNPKLIDPNTQVTSSKMALFEETVEELLENGHKVLVFSQFVGHLKLIEELLIAKRYNYKYLDGKTPLAQRQKAIESFQNGDGDIFLISLKAGGTGLNLTAADFVIHMDPWWNPAVEDQASDRVHRIGQDKPVTVYRLITENTIEEKIIDLHHSKRNLANALLDGTDISSRLSLEELINLLAT